jgi:hypothetical protein
MIMKDPMNTEAPWAADKRLPPVYVQIPDPAGAGWLGRRTAFFLNAGLTVNQIGPLLVPKLVASTRMLALGAVFAVLALGIFVSAALGIDSPAVAGLLFSVSAVVAAGSYVMEVRAFRENGRLWDQARDLTFSLHGDKLINLGAIPTQTARAEITVFVVQLAAARSAILRDHAGTGPVPGGQELLHALAAVGELARHLVDDPEGLGERGYSEVADSQHEARWAAVLAMGEFSALDPDGGRLLGPGELALIAKGTRK